MGLNGFYFLHLMKGYDLEKLKNLICLLTSSANLANFARIPIAVFARQLKKVSIISISSIFPGFDHLLEIKKTLTLSH